MTHGVAAGLALALTLALHVSVQGPPSAVDAIELLLGDVAESYEEALFLYASAPRTTMAVLAGAALGLAGSLLQQLLRNPLASPMTLGVASGAWFGVVLGTIVAPAFAARNGLPFSLGGACAAAALVAAIAGRRGLAGSPAVLAGMAANLFFGAAAQALLLAEDQTTRRLFVWGAGDPGQTGWDWSLWLAPQVALAGVAGLALARPLTLMRLGASAASGRGLNLRLLAPLAAGLAIWLTAAPVAAVGLIGFVGLIAPNLARLAGARSAGGELAASAAIGAATLLATDALALAASAATRELVPSGAAAALVGAPALLWLGLRRTPVEIADHPSPFGREAPAGPLLAALALALTVTLAAAILVGPTAQGWRIAAPGDLVVSLRWPRAIAAASAGAALAVSGAVLQRLLRNPLASPDVVGVTAGAALAMVGSVVLFGLSLREAGAATALRALWRRSPCSSRCSAATAATSARRRWPGSASPRCSMRCCSSRSRPAARRSIS